MADSARGAQVTFVDQMLRACSPLARGLLGSRTVGFDVRTGTTALTVPTTVIVGAADRLLPPVHSREIAGLLEEVGALHRHVVLDDIGHMLSIEAAAQFNEVLDEVIGLGERKAQVKAAKKATAGSADAPTIGS